MSERPIIEHAQPVGAFAVAERLRKVEARLASLSDELAANQREYEGLRDAYHVALSEHESLRAKLDILESSEMRQS
jgi:hypothetical protein